MRGHMIIAALALASASRGAAADQQPICADRPGKGDATCTAPAGHFQLEMALADWTLLRFPGERDASLALGATAIKYGLTDRSHIELDVTPYLRTMSRVAGVYGSASGFGDLVARYKQQLTAPSAALQITMFPFVKLPTAKRALGNGKLEGGLELPISYAIPRSTLSLGFAPQVAWLADQDRSSHHLAMVQTASVGWQATAKLNLSAELWGQWDWDAAGTGKQASADGSIAYLASKNVQFDAGANFGLNRQTPDVEVYSGISVRF